MGCQVFKRGTKLYIPSTLNIVLILWHPLRYTLASTIDCGYSKMLNHGLNHYVFSLVCVSAYLNFIFEFKSSFGTAQNSRFCLLVCLLWQRLGCPKEQYDKLSSPYGFRPLFFLGKLNRVNVT